MAYILLVTCFTLLKQDIHMPPRVSRSCHAVPLAAHANISKKMTEQTCTERPTRMFHTGSTALNAHQSSRMLFPKSPPFSIVVQQRCYLHCVVGGRLFYRLLLVHLPVPFVRPIEPDVPVNIAFDLIDRLRVLEPCASV